MITKTVTARRVAIALFCSTALSSVVPIQPVAAQSDSQNWDAFVGSRYNYCDAKMIGIVWGMTPEQGKVEIGYKVLHHLTSNLESVLQESRDAGYECAWEDTGLSYDDAVQLAYVWDLDDPYQAKLSAAYHYTQGESGIVGSALGR